jgi:hypothetical protein
MKSRMLDKETKFEIEHSRKNIIDIDEPTSSDITDPDEKEVKKMVKKSMAEQDNLFLKRTATQITGSINQVIRDQYNDSAKKEAINITNS